MDPIPLPGVNAQGLARLVSSSKGLIFLAVVAAGVALVLTGHLSADAVYSKIIALACVYFPAVAVEDASRHLADRPRAPGVVVNVPTVPPPPAPPDDWRPPGTPG